METKLTLKKHLLQLVFYVNCYLVTPLVGLVLKLRFFLLSYIELLGRY